MGQIIHIANIVYYIPICYNITYRAQIEAQITIIGVTINMFLLVIVVLIIQSLFKIMQLENSSLNTNLPQPHRVEKI